MKKAHFHFKVVLVQCEDEQGYGKSETECKIEPKYYLFNAKFERDKRGENAEKTR